MSQQYETSIEGLRVVIRWSPKARRYVRGVQEGSGLWVATIYGRNGTSLPGGSGISPYEAEKNTRAMLTRSRASNDRARARPKRKRSTANMSHCDACSKLRSDVRTVGDDSYGEASLCFLCRTEGRRNRVWSHELGRYVHAYDRDRRRPKRNTARSCGWGTPLSGISRSKTRRRRSRKRR